MPLHAVALALLLVGHTLSGQQAVPLIGFAEHDQSTVEHGCTPTGEVVQGSTHSYNQGVGDQYFFTGTVPDLPEVRCPTQPAEILSKTIEWEPLGSHRMYFIRFEVKFNVDGVGRIDIGGPDACYRSWQEHPSPGWKWQPYRRR